MPIKAPWVGFKKEIIGALALEESGVYELGYKKSDEVVYIGKSEDSIRSRLLDHKEKAKFVGVTHFRKRKTSPEEAPNTERKLLLEHKKRHGKLPRFNKSMPSDDPFRGILY